MSLIARNGNVAVVALHTEQFVRFLIEKLERLCLITWVVASL